MLYVNDWSINQNINEKIEEACKKIFDEIFDAQKMWKEAIAVWGDIYGNPAPEMNGLFNMLEGAAKLNDYVTAMNAATLLEMFIKYTETQMNICEMGVDNDTKYVLSKMRKEIEKFREVVQNILPERDATFRGACDDLICKIKSNTKDLSDIYDEHFNHLKDEATRILGEEYVLGKLGWAEV